MLYETIYKLYKLAELDAFKGRNMPDWIRDNPAFEGKKSIKKVFPAFGLKNFREKVEVIGSVNPAAKSANALTGDMIDVLFDSLEPIDIEVRKSIIKPITYRSVSNEEIALLREKFVRFQNKRSSISAVLREFQDAIRPERAVVSLPDGKVRILLQQDVSDENGKTIGKSNEPAFRVYEKIKLLIEAFGKEFGVSVAISNLDSIPSAKEFNRSNIPLAKNSMEVVFSAENEGAWDLATMSMRGVSTCQSWGREEETCLIGSILSKYAGIIYLTSGKDFEGRGENMVKRCLVRFGVNTKTKKPVIIMDRMFDSYDGRVAKLFVEALQKRTPLPILNYASTFSAERQPMLPKEEDIRLPADEKFHSMERALPSYKDTYFSELEKGDKTRRLTEKEQNDKAVDAAVSIANVVSGKVEPILMGISRGSIMYATFRPVYQKLVAFIRKHKVMNAELMKTVMLKELIKQSHKMDENEARYVEYCIESDQPTGEKYKSAIVSYWKQVRVACEKLLNKQ